MKQSCKIDTGIDSSGVQTLESSGCLAVLEAVMRGDFDPLFVYFLRLLVYRPPR